jgi:hypothetical protein
MNILSADVLESIFKYSGLTGVILLFLYLVFKSTIEKRFFPALTQKRKLYVITISLFSIWSLGVLVITLNFAKADAKTPPEKHRFIYSGQIINKNGEPLSNATAYILLGNDTIKAETPTGYDGTFIIRLDTIEGIKATVYISHPDYSSDTRFRPLIQSIPEQFILQKRKEVTFSTNLADEPVSLAIQKQTGYRQVANSSDYKVHFRYDAARLDSFDNKYRYLGGPVQVFINGKLCYQSKQPIKPTYAAGNSKTDLEAELFNSIRSIVSSEKNQFTQIITTCIESPAHLY